MSEQVVLQVMANIAARLGVLETYLGMISETTKPLTVARLKVEIENLSATWELLLRALRRLEERHA